MLKNFSQRRRIHQKDRKGRETRAAKNHRFLNHCHMASFTVRPGRRYRAIIRLRVFEAVASNASVAEELGNIGFTNVTVTGSGRERVAEGTWPSADTSAEIPDRIKSIEEL